MQVNLILLKHDIKIFKYIVVDKIGHLLVYKVEIEYE